MASKPDLHIIIPFYNGHRTIEKLINSLPKKFPIIIVDDKSEKELDSGWIENNFPEYEIELICLNRKGYFAGAVNRGIEECKTDVLVLNQDTWFDSPDDVENFISLRKEYAFFGERIRGIHPAFGGLGYVHGTCMLIRRDAIREVGLFNEKEYPLWGNTAEYQWRVSRKNFPILPIAEIKGFHHERPKGERYGSSIKHLLEIEKEKEKLLTRTPPIVSVIVPCFNYGRYLHDCINSLIGGNTSLGEMPGQTLQSFEIIIVDDASTDNSLEYIKQVTDISKGIQSYHLEKNVGTARTLNYGIERAVGKYITFLSADDMRESSSLESLVAACEKNPHSFAYDDVWLVNKHRRVKQWKVEEYDFEQLIWKNHIHAGILYPREAWVDVGGYPAIMGDGREDWAFNIALGIKGWCGVHVKEFGYLYRREGQNRTETNTTETHRERFLSKVMDLFPDIYRGYRPMPCCGKGGNTRRNVGLSSTIITRNMSMANESIGSQGMIKLEYIGEQMSFTSSGDATGAKYSFGKDRPKGWVDPRDVGSRDGKIGFLSKRDRSTGKWLYRLAETEKVSEPEPVAVVQIVEEPTLAHAEAVGTLSTIGNAVPSQPQFQVQSSALDYPDPTDLNVEEIKVLTLNQDQWLKVYKKELAGRNRKGAIAFMEELLANWQEDK